MLTGLKGSYVYFLTYFTLYQFLGRDKEDDARFSAVSGKKVRFPAVVLPEFVECYIYYPSVSVIL